MSDLQDPIETEPLTRALAHPLRARLLFEYQRDGVSPSRLATRLGKPLNVISYHTNVLVELGCIELVSTASRRGAMEHFYRTVALPAFEDEAWDELPVARRRSLTNAVLGSAMDEARRAAWAGGFDGPRSHLSRLRIELDAVAEAEVAGLLRRVVDEVIASDAACRRRSSATSPYELVMLCFAERPSAP